MIKWSGDHELAAQNGLLQLAQSLFNSLSYQTDFCSNLTHNVLLELLQACSPAHATSYFQFSHNIATLVTGSSLENF